MAYASHTLEALLGSLLNKYNTLLECPARFSGKYGEKHIQHFIDFVDTYKKTKDIDDTQALQELKHLLTENAHSWWMKQRSQFLTWSEAKSALQKQYSNQRAAPLIYADILKNTYGSYNSEEEFLNDKYELFYELPEPRPSERLKLDMILAILPRERRRILSEFNVSSFLELKQQLRTNPSKRKEKPKRANPPNKTILKDIETQSLSTQNKTAQNEIVSGKSQNKTAQNEIVNKNSQNKTAQNEIVNGNLQNKTAQNEIVNGNLQNKTAQNETVNGNSQNKTAHNEIVNGNSQQFIIHQNGVGMEDSMETPENPHMPKENVPFIKVRRTEDLMPEMKEEIEQEEFISTVNDVNSKHESTNNFQIDTDIMNQISNIIDESEMHSGIDSINLSMMLPESNPITIQVSGESVTVDDKSDNNTQSTNRVNKKKKRCSFCRRKGHVIDKCFKLRLKQKLYLTEEINDLDNYNIVTTIGKQQANLATSSNNTPSAKANCLPTIADPTSTHLVNNWPKQNTNSNSPTQQQNHFTQTSSTNDLVLSSNVAETSAPPPLGNILSGPTSSPAITQAATKLIAPINGLSSNKQITAKIRIARNPTSKCHQCGCIGFYKSICPNCSPIYNSNQKKP